MPLYINIPQRQYRNLKSEIDQAVLNVLNSERWLLGQETEKFAKQFAEYVGVPYCLPVANGTDALELVLRSINVPEGSGCVTVANAGGYTTTACHLVGLMPQYIDVAEDTLVMDVRLLSKIVTAQTKVIVATHLYGNVVDILAIRAVLKDLGREDIVVVEDCAQAHGAYCYGKRVGSLGDLAAFSFYPTKNLGALGDAGAIVTNDVKRYEKVKHLHQYGWTSRYHNDIRFGRNSRMDEIQATILAIKLPYLDQWNARRREIVKAYQEAMPSTWKSVTITAEEGVAHLAIFMTAHAGEREAILEALKGKDIMGDVHYPLLDTEQGAWKEHGECLEPLTVSLDAKERIFTLPCFPEMTDEEIHTICSLISTL